VLLSLLDSPSFAVVHPHQARLTLEILYRLVSSRFTAERTLQYADRTLVDSFSRDL
jgi:hypothetical protein